MTRTRADLEAAFALLARAAEEHTGDDAPDAPNDTTVVHLQSAPRTARHRPGWAVVAGAAAVAAAIVATVLLARGDGSGDGQAAGPPAQPAPRTLPLTVDRSLHLTLATASVQADSASVDLVDRHLDAQVTVAPAHAHQLEPGLTPVIVGRAHGWYTDGTKPVFVQPPDGVGTPAPPTPTPPETRYAPAVVWEYAPDAYAFVIFQGGRPSQAQLLRVARGVHVGGTHVLRSAVALRPGTDGLRLISLGGVYLRSSDPVPSDGQFGPWSTLAQFARPDGSGFTRVEATGVDLTADWRNGEALTVGGRRAYWHPQAHQLDVDWGQGRYLDVARNGATKAELITLARAVTLTPYPTEPGKWFDARTALP